MIELPCGYPENGTIFSQNCLLASIAVGTLYHEAQEEANEKKRRALERTITDINSDDKSNQISRRNLAGRKILQRCKDLIANTENITLQGPHTYKMAEEIASKNNIRIIVYKNNRIKNAYPKKFDGSKMQIALLEKTPSYLHKISTLKHVVFIRKPKRFFSTNLFQCWICLNYKSRDRNHNKVCLHIELIFR